MWSESLFGKGANLSTSIEIIACTLNRFYFDHDIQHYKNEVWLTGQFDFSCNTSETSMDSPKWCWHSASHHGYLLLSCLRREAKYKRNIHESPDARTTQNFSGMYLPTYVLPDGLNTAAAATTTTTTTSTAAAVTTTLWWAHLTSATNILKHHWRHICLTTD